MAFDLPEPARRVILKDVRNDDPFYNHIITVVGDGIMIAKDGYFNPKGEVTGIQAIRAIKRAMEVVKRKR